MEDVAPIIGWIMIFLPVVLLVVLQLKPKGKKMRRLEDVHIEEGLQVFSTIFGLGKCQVVMDRTKQKYFINVRFATGLEKAYDKTGKHDDHQVSRDLYPGTSHPWTTIL